MDGLSFYRYLATTTSSQLCDQLLVAKQYPYKIYERLTLEMKHFAYFLQMIETIRQRTRQIAVDTSQIYSRNAGPIFLDNIDISDRS